MSRSNPPLTRWADAGYALRRAKLLWRHESATMALSTSITDSARAALVALGVLCCATSADAQRILSPAEWPDPSIWNSAPTASASALTAQAPTYSTPYNFAAPGAAVPTFAPNVSVAAPAWDPYAAPGAAAPLYAPSPYAAQPGQPYANPFAGLPSTIEGYYRETIRVMQNVRAQHTFIGGREGNDFDINTTELSASFGIPFGQIQQPILITPRFNFHWWAGPSSLGVAPDRDLPARVYDAYLETSWRPQFTPRLGADLSVSVGVFGDLRYTDSHTLRVMGRGLGLVNLTPTATLALGVWYINRDRVKLLPAGGVIWTPHPDAKYEILFPNPKLAHRIANTGVTDYWGYIAGEYGGGQWTVIHQDDTRDVVNYNDMRLILGVEATTNQRLKGNFDIGYVFNREILYRNGTPQVEPGDSVMVRLGLQY